MKHEIGITQPPYLIEDWPGKYDVFSWLEYVVTVPDPIFLVTTRKANANLDSWGLLVGERDHYSSPLAVLEHTHNYANILLCSSRTLDAVQGPSFGRCAPCQHVI